MNWKNLSYAKKGAIIGLIIGIFFGMYGSGSRCLVSPVGAIGCDGFFIKLVFLIEFFSAVSVSLIPRFMGLKISPESYILFSPIITLGVLGIIIGWIVGKIKSKKVE